MNEYFKDISCIPQITQAFPFLSGEGVIIAVLDSGIDYFLPEFIDNNNKTRILAIWDQSAKTDEENQRIPPKGYSEGVLYTRDMINDAIALGREKGSELVPVFDISGHGTAVASVAAGSIIGVAPKSDIVVVKLGNPQPESFPKTTQLMRGLDYVIKLGLQLNRPVAINLSFGNTYGDHLGNSLLERFIDNVSEIGKTAVVIGSGNEGFSRGHTSGIVKDRQIIELAVADYETGLSIQLWKYYQDVFNITLVSPSGEKILLETSKLNEAEAVRKNLGRTQLLCYLGTPLPYSVSQEIFIDMIPNDNYIESGIWSFELEPVSIVTGEYRFYLSSYAIRNAGTGFFLPTPEMTITIPSTARRAITVGAYDAALESYADFSGRGYVYRYVQGRTDMAEIPYGISAVKPDLVAPGVNISVAKVNGGYEQVSGTSFAAPFVTGAAALMMEWGIVKQNDIYMYGEKLKAYLIRGARQLSGFAPVPNPQVGWGALCARESLNLK